jgi:hypothetical protein
MKSILLGTLTALTITTANAAESQTTCLAAALSDYVKTNTALLASAGANFTVETRLSQRRLEEQYCVGVARCRVGDSPAMRLPLAAVFSSCLDEEAKERSKL